MVTLELFHEKREAKGNRSRLPRSELTPDGIRRVARREKRKSARPEEEKRPGENQHQKRAVRTLSNQDKQTAEEAGPEEPKKTSKTAQGGGGAGAPAACGKRSTRKEQTRRNSDRTHSETAAGTAEAAS